MLGHLINGQTAMIQSLKLDIELAWAAGFFDGEGSTICVIYPSSTIRRLDLVVSQVHRNTLERFQRAIGNIGRIQNPRILPNRQPIYRFIAHGDQAREALNDLWPFLSAPKREQALAALVQYNFRTVGNRGGLDFCKRGHSMAGAYISKDGSRECRTCRNLRRSGPLPKVSSPTAYEYGIGVRQYSPADYVPLIET